MASGNLDHNHYSQQQSLDSTYPSTPQPARQPPPPFDLEKAGIKHEPINRPASTSPTLPLSPSILPALVYSAPRSPPPPASTLPSIITREQGRNNENSSHLNGTSTRSPAGDRSPDPHEFYRQLNDPFTRRSPASSDPPAHRSARQESEPGMATITTTQRFETSAHGQSSTLTKPPPHSRNGTRSAQRIHSVPQDAHTRGARTPDTMASARPAPKPRQSSLQDLVNRFNQTKDESLPAPTKLRKASDGRNSPITTRSRATTPKHPEIRSPSQPSKLVKTTGGRGTPTGKDSPRMKRSIADAASPKSSSTDQLSHTTERSRTSLTNNPWASHSMNSLHLSRNEASQKPPLFGEVLGPAPGPLDLGFGIPNHGRRGSDGSSHLQTPKLHRRSRSDRDVSPSSPTAWYLGVSPSLDEIDVNREPGSSSRSLHRRARSDFAGDPTIPANVSGLGLLTPMEPPRPESNPKSTPKATTRKPTPSRIPVSSRRGSTDSAASSRSARSNSALSTPPGSRVARPKGSGNLSEKSFNRDGVRPTTPAQLDPRLHAMSPSRPRGTSPRLKAYITAPLPKKSPPLRSSRPRQPVSTATTSASRNKVVDRYDPAHPQDRASTRTARLTKEPKDAKAKPKDIPELGAVDFAARRERIQRAFTISMRQKEKQDEDAAAKRLERRKARDRERQATSEPRSPRKSKPGDGAVKPDDRKPQPHKPQLGKTKEPSPSKRVPRADRQLSVDTSHSTPRPSLDASTGRNVLEDPDSPTLGIPGGFPDPKRQPGRAESAEPSSAVTTDTATTPIDAEPQIEPPLHARLGPQKPHQTVLSQILQMRESMTSTSPAPTQFHDDTASERDDQESIRIMLGRTPVDGRPPSDGHDYATARRMPRVLGTDQLGSRWSMDSYGSFSRAEQSDRERDSYIDPTDGTAASSESTRGTSVERDSQPWLGDDHGHPKSGHTTLDSESYSTINKVLDHYHNSNMVSPEMFHDFQKQMLTKSPELARQGGWDPKRVTQLYLQELGRGKSFAKRPSQDASRAPTSHSDAPLTTDPAPPREPEPLGTAIILKTGREATEPSSDKQVVDGNRLAPHQDDDHRYQLSDEAWSAVTPSLEIPDELPLNRASLTGPDDWMDASPSMASYMHLQAADSPHEDRRMDFRPAPPPKDRDLSGTSDHAHDRSDTRTPRLGSVIPPGLPELQSTGGGLGLVLQVDPSGDDADHATPPLPTHSPPPVPVTHARQPSYDPFRATDGLRSPPSPSVYSRNPPSSIFPSVFPEGMAAGLRSRNSEGAPQVPDGVPVKPRSMSKPALGKRSQSEQQARRASVTAATPSISSISEAEQKRVTKRRFIIKELLDTEKQFHGDMKVTEEIYKGTSNACSAVSSEDVKVLFGNIEQIVAFSLDFFDSLRQAAASVYVVRQITTLSSSKRSSLATSNSGTEDNGSGSTHMELTDEEKDKRTFVGEAFGRHMAQIEKVYSEYLKNLEAANKRLHRLQANPGVVLWLNECRSHAEDLTDTWSLDSLIVKPMQRILKYPLLLQALSEVTPEDHPDFTAVDIAFREMKAVTTRIEEMMKRVDLMEQAVGRKRKESDVRTGISKAFGRRTEKLKQQVGLSEMFDDIGFNRVAEKWDSHVIQLQFSMADVDKYLNDVQIFVNRFIEYVASIEHYMDVGRSSFPELESKWRKFGMAMREVSSVALTDHKSSVQKTVIGPMKTLVKLYDGPQKIIQKRNKRIMDYARYKGVKDRGDKPDKRLQEQGEQFMALNETLKEELPKLYSLTGKLAEACLSNLIQIQSKWYTIWQGKLKSILDEHQVPRNVAEIVNQFAGDFPYTEAQVNSMGICNGAILADSVNLLGHTTSAMSGSTAVGGSSNRHDSLPGSRSRTRSMNSNPNNSPVMPGSEFGKRISGTFLPSHVTDGIPPMPSTAGSQSAMSYAMGRMRANSSHSSTGGNSVTPDLSSTARSFYAMTPATSSNQSNQSSQHNAPPRPSTSTGRSVDYINHNQRRISHDPSPAGTRPVSGSTYFSANTGDTPRRPSSPSFNNNNRPFSGVFSSAMPMTDSPATSPHPSRPSSPHRPPINKAIVLFTTASIEEFNIDRSRTEAGYPYLTYVKGEIFDVIAEKGELWLAKNQDDRSQTVGWLWCKHFVKLTEAS